MAGRSGKPVSHSRKTRDQRFAEALSSLAIRRRLLHTVLEAAHTDHGCLPLPTIELPGSPDDLDQLATAVFVNLFTGRDRAQHWIDARTRCPHLTAERVIDINELVYKWYQLLCAAEHHLTSRPVISLEMAESSFDHILADFCAANGASTENDESAADR